jgi:hypothetical protein
MIERNSDAVRSSETEGPQPLVSRVNDSRQISTEGLKDLVGGVMPHVGTWVLVPGSNQCVMEWASSLTLRWVPLRIDFSVISANHRSTRFSQELDVGVK